MGPREKASRTGGSIRDASRFAAAPMIGPMLHRHRRRWWVAAALPVRPAIPVRTAARRAGRADTPARARRSGRLPRLVRRRPHPTPRPGSAAQPRPVDPMTRPVTGVDVGWLLSPAGPAHRPLPRGTRAVCGVSLVDAMPATRLQCQVYRIDLLSRVLVGTAPASTPTAPVSRRTQGISTFLAPGMSDRRPCSPSAERTISSAARGSITSPV